MYMNIFRKFMGKAKKIMVSIFTLELFSPDEILMLKAKPIMLLRFSPWSIPNPFFATTNHEI
ncbi:hypothetical protein QG37_08372 [Candidozyma auris]|uniref:Uncharacterized protein n=1 Tax=Candidozyma auris TaxID=498019 RepID=A0A0L0NMY7_CANAR|nr:hypothetical protein QG37_08372 [[Candida] auris]